MVFFTYIINLITNIMTSIVIPVPFSTEKIYYFSIFSIFMGILVISIIVYFITKLIGIESNIFWNSVSSDLSKIKSDKYSTIHRTVNNDGTNNYTITSSKDYRRVKNK